MHPWPIPCLTGGEGGLCGERRGRGELGREGEIKYKLFFYFLDKLN